MVDITDVQVLNDRGVQLRFPDGTWRVVDLKPFLLGQAFEEIATDNYIFSQVAADPETGTIGWPNGADLDPNVLHDDFEAASPAITKS